jgi:regulator of cell morphogenesis and NO signaling
MNDYLDKTVGELVAERPSRSRVFEAHKIDFCCGGKRPLEEACTRKGLSLTAIVEELATHDAQAPDMGAGAADLDTVDLIDHIVETHHVYLKAELPRLARMAEKVARVHGDAEPSLHEVRTVFDGLEAELTTHMGKEEVILFPMVKQLVEGTLRAQQAAFLGGPMGVMEAEHDSAGEALDRLHTLTGAYTPPEWACNTFRALFDGLAELERDLHLHIHKENNILFPRVREEVRQMALSTP